MHPNWDARLREAYHVPRTTWGSAPTANFTTALRRRSKASRCSSEQLGYQSTGDRFDVITNVFATSGRWPPLYSISTGYRSTS